MNWKDCGAMKPEKIRTQLDRNEWIDSAIAALADEGLAGMRVEILAKRFGVTKGSFYWHFKDRKARRAGQRCR